MQICYTSVIKPKRLHKIQKKEQAESTENIERHKKNIFPKEQVENADIQKPVEKRPHTNNA